MDPRTIVLDIPFLASIDDFPQKFRVMLIEEYNRVFSEMPARRAEILAAYPSIPGNVLQRSPANTYSNGNFIVFWFENKLQLYNPDKVLAFLRAEDPHTL